MRAVLLQVPPVNGLGIVLNVELKLAGEFVI